MKALSPFAIDQALAMIMERLPEPGPVQQVSLGAAAGRVCAREVTAPGDQPRFVSAAMDGWAVSGVHQTYQLVGESRAGAGFAGTLADGQAVRISTGAVMPAGADALVRREQGREQERLVQVAACRPGRDIRQRGCDFRQGDVLLAAGRVIDHLDVARVAAAGLAYLPVTHLPRVAVLATGDEIVPAGCRIGAAGNYDALSPALLGRLRGMGIPADHLGIAGDSEAAIAARLAGLCSDEAAEVLIVIGGASGGRHDRVRHALAARGLSVMVPGVAMRPGKPFWCGVMDGGRLVFGLPGNPVAALVALELFVVPALRAMMGVRMDDACAQRWIDLPDHPAGDAGEAARVRFARWGLDWAGRVQAQVLGEDDSAALSPLGGANGLIRTGEGAPCARLLPLAFTLRG